MNPYDEQLARWATALLKGGRSFMIIGKTYTFRTLKRWHDGHFDGDGDWRLWDIDKIRLVQEGDLAGPEDLYLTWRGIGRRDRPPRR
jgi:hypothetical protein